MRLSNGKGWELLIATLPKLSLYLCVYLHTLRGNSFLYSLFQANYFFNHSTLVTNGSVRLLNGNLSC